MKGLDHLVICVDDLTAAVTDFSELGFTFTPKAKHPFGTHNQLIQLDNFFLELLTVAEPEKLPEPVEGGFSFALFNQLYLSRQQGISMIVLDSDDFRADHTNALKNGLKTYEPFEFTRATTLPDGATAQVSFGLNFVSHDAIPMAGFFTCQQFNPEHFWFDQYQNHTNSASSIKEVCMVAETPEKIAPFLATFAHSKVHQKGASETKVPTSRGNLVVRTPQSYEQRYETTAPQLTNGPAIAGIVIGVDDITAVKNRAANLYGMSILFEQKE